MVIALTSQIESPGLEPWPETLCSVLEQDTLLSQCLSLPRCTLKWIPANLKLGETLHRTSIPSRGVSKYS